MSKETEQDSQNEAWWDAAQEGAELLREGELDAARVELETQLASDSENPYVYFFLGSVHFEAAAFDRSMKAYLECLQRSPDHLGAMSGLGWALQGMGRYKESIRTAQQLLHRKKVDPDALHLLGVCHFCLGESQAAKRYLEQFLETRPEIEVAMEVQGMLDTVGGQVEPVEEGRIPPGEGLPPGEGGPGSD